MCVYSPGATLADWIGSLGSVLPCLDESDGLTIGMVFVDICSGMGITALDKWAPPSSLTSATKAGTFTG